MLSIATRYVGATRARGRVTGIFEAQWIGSTHYVMKYLLRVMASWCGRAEAGIPL